MAWMGTLLFHVSLCFQKPSDFKSSCVKKKEMCLRNQTRFFLFESFQTVYFSISGSRSLNCLKINKNFFFFLNKFSCCCSLIFVYHYTAFKTLKHEAAVILHTTEILLPHVSNKALWVTWIAQERAVFTVNWTAVTVCLSVFHELNPLSNF